MKAPIVARKLRNIALLVAPVIVAVVLWDYRSLFSEHSPSYYELRNSNFPSIFISEVHMDLTTQLVSLSWSGAGETKGETGPFLGAPGKGLGDNDCDSVEESNRPGSNCTPKGTWMVEGVGDQLPTSPNCHFVTWFDMKRSLAFHSHKYVPDVPVSHGCVRLEKHVAQLIHDNVLVGKSIVVVDGQWHRPQIRVDRDKLSRQLMIHEGRRAIAYRDNQGVAKIGVGFDLQRRDARSALERIEANYEDIANGRSQLNDRQIEDLFQADLEVALVSCNRVFQHFTELSDVRQRVLADIMFNLGAARLGSFQRMIESVNRRDYSRTADEIVDSRWYKQVRGRGRTLEVMMRTDKDCLAISNEAAPWAKDPLRLAVNHAARDLLHSERQPIGNTFTAPSSEYINDLNFLIKYGP